MRREPYLVQDGFQRDYVLIGNAQRLDLNTRQFGPIVSVEFLAETQFKTYK